MLHGLLSRKTNIYVDVTVTRGSDSHNQMPTHFNPRKVSSDAYSSENSIFTVCVLLAAGVILLSKRPIVYMQPITGCDCMKR